MDSQCAATSSCSTSPSQECYEIEGSGLTLISLLFNGLVSRLDLFKHGTHLFYRGPTVMAGLHLLLSVLHYIGAGGVYASPTTSICCTPTTGRRVAQEACARRRTSE